MKKGIVLVCCAMLLAGQLQSAEALDWKKNWRRQNDRQNH